MGNRVRQHGLKKIQYFFFFFAKSASFCEGIKIRGAALNCRNGNTIFTKMSRLKNGLLLPCTKGKNHDNTW